MDTHHIKLNLRFAILAGTLLIVALGIYFLRLREPSYKGRTLTQWMDDYYGPKHTRKAEPLTDPVYLATSQAIEKIGQDAVPLLLKWAETEDSIFNKQIINLCHKQRFVTVHFHYDFQLHEFAILGFRVLGANASNAAPALIQLAKSPKKSVRMRALECLSHINPQKELLLPVLLEGIHDPDPELQKWYIYELYWLYPDEAKKLNIRFLASGGYLIEGAGQESNSARR